jgi:Ca2+-binding RTX toxin-like protein
MEMALTLNNYSLNLKPNTSILLTDFLAYHTTNQTDFVLYGTSKADQINGGLGNDMIYGYEGNDTIDGGLGLDTIYAGDGDDTFYSGAGAGSGSENVYGGNGNDILTATLSGTSSVSLYGDAGNDIITGSIENDILIGGDGDDVIYGRGGTAPDGIYGGAGDDTIVSGFGADFIYGDAGADVFSFAKLNSAGINGNIFDFKSPEFDKIDISGIDANANTVANDSFSFVSIFTNQAGQLTFDSATNKVAADTNGDDVADFYIQLGGVPSLSAIDFIL